MEAREPAPIDASATVESTLLRFPEAAAVFHDHQMACAGCVMSCFDTLADAALIYDIPIETLLAEIEALTCPGPAPRTQEATP